MGRSKPPTRVNCAPRMMALGSKAVSMAYHAVVEDASARREVGGVGPGCPRSMTCWIPRLAPAWPGALVAGCCALNHGYGWA
jgi:hypothetical protein